MNGIIITIFMSISMVNNMVYLHRFMIIFHGYPLLYNKNDINPLTKKTFNELYKNTIEKKTLIKNNGYKNK